MWNKKNATDNLFRLKINSPFLSSIRIKFLPIEEYTVLDKYTNLEIIFEKILKEKTLSDFNQKLIVIHF